MPETMNIEFDYKEVAEALVRYHNINEGLWGISIKFGIAGANITQGKEGTDLIPSAIVPVLKIGLQKFDQPNSLSVDASKINPKKKSSKKK